MSRAEVPCIQCGKIFIPEKPRIVHCSQQCRNISMRSIVYGALTAERLRELLKYEPKTGEFIWLVGKSNVLPGSSAGAVSNSRRSIRIDGKMYRASRLAWMYMTGEWPNGEVDHIDTNSMNDAWANLRDVSRQVNQQNQRKPLKTNKLGFLGVSKYGNGYLARIHANGVTKCLGTYSTPEKAHEVYLSAKRDLHTGSTL